MKFLIDENLSDKLVARLDADFPGTQHVKHVLMSAKPDADLWELAKREGFIILTQDDDFVEMSALRGTPPKVVHLSMGNHTTKEWLAIIQANALVKGQFERDAEIGLLVIK